MRKSLSAGVFRIWNENKIMSVILALNPWILPRVYVFLRAMSRAAESGRPASAVFLEETPQTQQVQCAQEELARQHSPQVSFDSVEGDGKVDKGKAHQEA